MGHGFPRLASAQPINRDGPYKRPTSENGGIFGGGSLIRPASVNRFLTVSVNRFYEAVECDCLG